MNPTTKTCRVCGEPVTLADSAVNFENCRPVHESCLLKDNFEPFLNLERIPALLLRVKTLLDHHKRGSIVIHWSTDGKTPLQLGNLNALRDAFSAVCENPIQTPRVVVTVQGGCAEVTENHGGIEVEIRDLDNEKNG